MGLLDANIMKRNEFKVEEFIRLNGGDILHKNWWSGGKSFSLIVRMPGDLQWDLLAFNYKLEYAYEKELEEEGKLILNKT